MHIENAKKETGVLRGDRQTQTLRTGTSTAPFRFPIGHCSGIIMNQDYRYINQILTPIGFLVDIHIA
jgi:hypothetical protein